MWQSAVERNDDVYEACDLKFHWSSSSTKDVQKHHMKKQKRHISVVFSTFLSGTLSVISFSAVVLG